METQKKKLILFQRIDKGFGKSDIGDWPDISSHKWMLNGCVGEENCDGAPRWEITHTCREKQATQLART